MADSIATGRDFSYAGIRATVPAGIAKTGLPSPRRPMDRLTDVGGAESLFRSDSIATGRDFSYAGIRATVPAGIAKTGLPSPRRPMDRLTDVGGAESLF